MSLTIDRFAEFFRTAWGFDPFPWQTRLAKQVFKTGWPDCIDLPTASGKTTCIDIAVFVLACQAALEENKRQVGRRIFFTVNRRVIVDEAFNRADRLAEKLIKAEESETGILGEVARALRSINEVSDRSKAPPLDRVQLRGGIFRDRAWARSITQPMIVCTTADQVGSRLLFRGYGVTTSAAPIHAALCGCDSLILLDEAHVTRAFSQTMQLLTRYQGQHATAPKMHYVQMTATPAGEVSNRFGLDEADLAHPILNARQKAKKLANLVSANKKTFLEKLVEPAIASAKDGPKAIGVIVNRVQTARNVEAAIRAELAKNKIDAEVHLVIGRMRPIDRDDLQERLRTLVGPDRPEAMEKSVFVIATQCLEVGADYDFDALITECASIDALRQRFGRLNRKGRPIEAVAAIIAHEESLKGSDPIYGDAIKTTWDWLTEDERESIDFGIHTFKKLWESVDNEKRSAMLSPAANAAVLLPAHLDALCQTAPQPEPSPDVSLFIHGPQRDNAEVNVCWRADLGPDNEAASERWPEIVRLLPPTSPECMTVPLVAMKHWMGERFKTDADADIPIGAAEPEEKRDSKSRHKRIVIWRFGRKPDEDAQRKRRQVGFVTTDPCQLKPGDTIVMPVSSRSWLELGHVPNADRSSYEELPHESQGDFAARCAAIDRLVDVAERTTRQSRLRLAIRLHEAFPGRSELRELSARELRPQLLNMLTAEITDVDERRHVLAVLTSRFERHAYDVTNDDNPKSKQNELIVFKTLIEPLNRLELPALDEDDGEDDLSEGNAYVSLEEHTRHVVDQLAAAAEKLSLTSIEQTAQSAAKLHDLGKADSRFQAVLAGITPYEAMMRLTLLGKGDGVRRTQAENQAISARAMYPSGFRHEMLSVELIQHLQLEAELTHRELMLHLIAAHHGYARPFAPVCLDTTKDAELLSIHVNGHEIDGAARRNWIPSHRLDSGVAERFWNLVREHGWWGLAWLESILRLADQQASAAEQVDGDCEGGKR